MRPEARREPAAAQEAYRKARAAPPAAPQDIAERDRVGLALPAQGQDRMARLVMAPGMPVPVARPEGELDIAELGDIAHLAASLLGLGRIALAEARPPPGLWLAMQPGPLA